MQAATKVAARVPAKSRVHAIFVVFQWPSCCASHSYPKLLDASSMPPAPFQAGVIPSLPSPTGVPGHEVQLRSSAKIIRDHAEHQRPCRIHRWQAFFFRNLWQMVGWYIISVLFAGNRLYFKPRPFFVRGTYYDLATSGWHWLGCWNVWQLEHGQKQLTTTTLKL